MPRGVPRGLLRMFLPVQINPDFSGSGSGPAVFRTETRAIPVGTCRGRSPTWRSGYLGFLSKSFVITRRILGYTIPCDRQPLPRQIPQPVVVAKERRPAPLGNAMWAKEMLGNAGR
jgi:hypothetical protein